MPNILITICARGGSKGIPGKNIKLIGRKPLLAYTIESALSFSKACKADVALSSDSEEIINTGTLFGIENSHLRPPHLANDTCGKPDAIKEVLLWMENKMDKIYDYIIDLDVTSPIRSNKDIQNCLDMICDDPELMTVFSVNPCARNPYFNMVEAKPDGYCKVVLGGIYKTRQAAPRVYDMNASIYIYKRAALDRENPKAITEKSKFFVMNHICFDLDEPSDFEYLEYLLDKGKLTNILQ